MRFTANFSKKKKNNSTRCMSRAKKNLQKLNRFLLHSWEFFVDKERKRKFSFCSTTSTNYNVRMIFHEIFLVQQIYHVSSIFHSCIRNWTFLWHKILCEKNKNDKFYSFLNWFIYMLFTIACVLYCIQLMSIDFLIINLVCVTIVNSKFVLVILE